MFSAQLTVPVMPTPSLTLFPVSRFRSSEPWHLKQIPSQRWFLHIQHWHSPCKSWANNPSLFKGLLRQKPSKSPHRLPLTADLLLICLQAICSRYGIPQVAQTLEAMFLLAFFGFLRCSKFTISAIHFDSSHHACISDLSCFSDDTMVFYLKRTKISQSGPPTPVFNVKVQSPLNPFETLAKFLHFHKSQRITMMDPLIFSKSRQMATRFWDALLTQFKWWERASWWISCHHCLWRSPTPCRSLSQNWAAPSVID